MDRIDDVSSPNWPKFHVHDFGHNLKNAEASLETGSHFSDMARRCMMPRISH